jgi:hypothetical protein
MHVPGQSGCAAIACDLCRCQRICLEVRAQPTVRLRNADREQSRGMQVPKIIRRKTSLAIVTCGAWGKLLGSQALSSGNQRSPLLTQAECLLIEHRSIRMYLRFGHLISDLAGSPILND